MAKFNESDGSLRPAPEPRITKTRKPRKLVFDECRSCGWKTKRTRSSAMINETLDGMCMGCAKHFGHGDVFGRGVTDRTYEQTLEDMNELEEAKHVMCLETREFGVVTTGDTIGVDFGDVFQIFRIGTDLEPTGDYHWALLAYSVGIKINGHELTLFPHEVMPIHWIRIMELKKCGSYEEAYVTTADQSGYWRPSNEMKSEIVNTYGDR